MCGWWFTERPTGEEDGGVVPLCMHGCAWETTEDTSIQGKLLDKESKTSCRRFTLVDVLCMCLLKGLHTSARISLCPGIYTSTNQQLARLGRDNYRTEEVSEPCCWRNPPRILYIMYIFPLMDHHPDQPETKIGWSRKHNLCVSAKVLCFLAVLICLCAHMCIVTVCLLRVCAQTHLQLSARFGRS